MAATPALSIFLVMLAMSMQESSAEGSSWCVCKPELPAAALQKTLDYACGHGADCAPVLPGGQCHTDTDTVASRCSYAANSYYHDAMATANGGGDATCDFGGTATLTSTDPSSGTCRYPATTASASSPAGAPRELWLFLLAIIAIFASLCCCVEMHEQRRKTCRH